jgi:hypothetical protein
MLRSFRLTLLRLKSANSLRSDSASFLTPPSLAEWLTTQGRSGYSVHNPSCHWQWEYSLNKQTFVLNQDSNKIFLITGIFKNIPVILLIL